MRLIIVFFAKFRPHTRSFIVAIILVSLFALQVQPSFASENNLPVHYPSPYWNTDGETATTHIFVGGVPVATIETSGTSTPTFFWNHADRLGSTRIVTDKTGKVVETADYEPFGDISSEVSLSGHREQRKFTGHEFDADTSYTYAEARYLNTEWGRFLSQDSEYLAVGDKNFEQNYNRTLENYLSDPQLANSYSYASNNPIRFVDPDGRQVADPSLAFAPSLASQIAAGILATGAVIASAPAWVPVAIVVGIVGVIGATYYFSQPKDGTGDTPSDTPQTASNPAPATPQSAPKPVDIQGKTPEEISQIMKGKGWEQIDPSRGGGDRYVKPGSPGEQVRLEPGNPKNSDPVKRGPYGRISTGGPKGGETSPPVPLKGNPTLKP